MPLSAETAILLVGAGLVAGFVNTVAGGGSVVSIPVLVMAFHGDANLARPRVAQVDVFTTKDFGTTGLVDADAARHGRAA